MVKEQTLDKYQVEPKKEVGYTKNKLTINVQIKFKTLASEHFYKRRRIGKAMYGWRRKRLYHAVQQIR